MTNHGKKAVLLTVLATTMALGAAGCGDPAREGTGTNDTVKTKMLTNNYRPFSYGTGNNKDLRLGFDRYRGTDPDLIRDSSDMRLGLNRDNGFSGYDQDGVNNWRDYKETAHDHANTSLENNQQLAQEITSLGPVDSASVMLAGRAAYVALKTKTGEDLDSAGHLKTQIADKVHMARPEIENVYVSSNPDLMNSFQKYGEQLRQGNPISGLMNEFNAMVQKVFPTNASYGTNESYNQINSNGMGGTMNGNGMNGNGVNSNGVNGAKAAPSAP